MPDEPALRSNTGARRHARLLDSAQHFALRRALPAYRTTSKAALQVEASCPPMDIFLDATLDSAALRISTLDDHHPLLRRVRIPWADTGPAPTHEGSRADLPPVELCAERSARTRPFSTRLTHLALRIPDGVERAHPAERSLALADQVRFEEWVEDRPVPQGHDILNVFTDGSMIVSSTGERRTGAGWVLAIGQDILEQHCVHTGDSREVFDAEAIALGYGIRFGLLAALRLGVKTVVTHTDNQAVLASLKSMKMRSSYSVFNGIARWARGLLEANRDMRVSIRWVKGHVQVEGNELADAQAERAARRDEAGIQAHPVAASLATARRRVKERAQAAWAQRWEQDRASQGDSVYFRHRTLPPSLKPSPLLADLKRREYALLLHLRTGHGDFAEYHDRFAHEDADKICVCGSAFTRLHPLICEAFASHHACLTDKDGRRMTNDELLSSPEGAAALLEFARSSKAFRAHKRRTAADR